MPSPFPGMDPYIEAPGHWRDFHGLFVTVLRIELAGLLKGRYSVRMDDDVYIHEFSAEERRRTRRPDVYISTERTERTAPDAGVAVLDAPLVGELPMAVDVIRERFIEIRDLNDRRLVTAIELLSPTNKSDHREEYLAKRKQYLNSDVNLVEIDLLRAGERMPVTNLPDCDYCVIVSPSVSRPNAGIWAWNLRDPMPEIKIPLGRNDAPIAIALRGTFDRTYDQAVYDDLYRRPISPPVSAEDEAWVKEILTSVQSGRL